jgi:hypothetical protein
MLVVLTQTGFADEPCRALRDGAPCRLVVSIGGITLGLSAASDDELGMPPEMEAFRMPTLGGLDPRLNPEGGRSLGAPCDIEIEVERVPQLEFSTERKVFDSGGIWTAHENSGGFIFDFTTPVFGRAPYKRLFVDRSFRRASLLLNRLNYPHGVVSPLEYPADELLIIHRLAGENGVEFHGCGIVDGKCGGQLFLGHSGAGKSTTTRLWKSIRDVRVLSDDRIIVRHGVAIPGSPLTAQPASRRDTWMYGTPWHGEAAFALPERARLQRIFIIEHGPQNRIQPLTKARAVAEMFARCFVPFYSREHLEATLACLNEIADALPCYRLEFIPTPSAVEMILDFQD